MWSTSVARVVQPGYASLQRCWSLWSVWFRRVVQFGGNRCLRLLVFQRVMVGLVFGKPVLLVGGCLCRTGPLVRGRWLVGEDRPSRRSCVVGDRPWRAGPVGALQRLGWSGDPLEGVARGDRLQAVRDARTRVRYWLIRSRWFASRSPPRTRRHFVSGAAPHSGQLTERAWERATPVVTSFLPLGSSLARRPVRPLRRFPRALPSPLCT